MKSLAELNTVLKQKWLAMPIGERRRLAAGGVVIVLIVLVFGVLLPLQDAKNRLLSQVAKERQRTANMAAMRSELERLSALPPKVVADGEALRGAMELSASAAFGKGATNVLLDQDVVRLRLANVPFEALIKWIDGVRREQGVHVKSVLIHAENAGVCNVTLDLVGVAQ